MAIRALPPKPKITPVVCVGRRRPKLDQRGVEGEVGPSQLRGNPYAHEHAEHGPGHRQHDADLDRVVVIVVEPLTGRLRGVEGGKHDEDEPDTCHHDDEAMHAHWVGAAGGRHGQPCERDKHQNDDRKPAFD